MKKIIALLALTASIASAVGVKIDFLHANLDVQNCIKSGDNVTCKGNISFDQETSILIGNNYYFSIVSPDGQEVSSADIIIQGKTAVEDLDVHDGINYPFILKFKNYKSSQLKYFYAIYSGGHQRIKIEDVPFFISGTPVVSKTTTYTTPATIVQHKYNVTLQNCITIAGSDTFGCTALFSPQK